MVKSAVYDAVGLSIFVLMTDALTRANASKSVSRSAFGGCLQTLALCTVSNFADTLRRFAVYPRFALCRAALLNPTTKKHILQQCVFFCAEIKSRTKKDTANSFFNLKTFCNMKTCRFQQALCFFGFCHKTIFYSFASVSHIRQLIQMFQR